VTTEVKMEKRTLGQTGLSLSILGFGGFHLVEIPLADASRLLNAYLDAGGNYIETAAGYGDGNSESKIGASVSRRRGEFVLASKSVERTRMPFLPPPAPWRGRRGRAGTGSFGSWPSAATGGPTAC
jgi:aryl-alcohol dehydrogenase-like predicted oxidoreductase